MIHSPCKFQTYSQLVRGLVCQSLIYFQLNANDLNFICCFVTVVGVFYNIHPKRICYWPIDLSHIFTNLAIFHYSFKLETWEIAFIVYIKQAAESYSYMFKKLFDEIRTISNGSFLKVHLPYSWITTSPIDINRSDAMLKCLVRGVWLAVHCISNWGPRAPWLV